MSRPLVSRRAPAPPHAVQVLSGGGMDAGVEACSLTSGLAARGLRLTVYGPRGALAHGRGGLGRASFARILTGSGPAAVLALRSVCADADLVHAHGLRAALLAALALAERRDQVPLVVTWRPEPIPPGPAAPLVRLLERYVLRRAAIVLAASPELVAQARGRGARDARLAPLALPAPSQSTEAVRPYRSDLDGDPPRSQAQRTRAELGTVGRPLLLAVGRLAPGEGYRTLLTAARFWSRLEPRPLLAIAGEGPSRAALQRRIQGEALPVRLLGRRDDVPALLTAADAAVVSGRRGTRSPLARAALRAGVPLVATAAGEPAELVGEATLLVPYGDATALAQAVGGLLGDSARGTGAASHPAHWLAEHRAVAQVLSVYDELTSSPRRTTAGRNAVRGPVVLPPPSPGGPPPVPATGGPPSRFGTGGPSDRRSSGGQRHARKRGARSGR